MQRLIDEIAGHPPSALDANQGAFLRFMNLMLLGELLPSVSFRVAVMALRSDIRMPATKALVAATSAAPAALIATQAAQPRYRSRGAASVRPHRAPPEAYNSQRNPRYGLARGRPCSRTTWSRVIESSGTIRILSFGARYCATIIPAGLIVDPASVPRGDRGVRLSNKADACTHFINAVPGSADRYFA
jgi:hypothetical protein